ncbi:16587_t:CDS:2, partial [Rhizophagus irregularis]
EYQIEESHDEFSSNDEENIIKISPNPSSSEESENSSNNITENNSLNNTLRINISTLGNSTRTSVNTINTTLTDFNNVYAANSYDGDQIEKLRKVKSYLKDKAADWLKGINGITNFNGAADNTSLSHQMESEYATKFNKLLKRVVSDNNNLHDRFKVNYFIQKLNSIIAERIFEGNSGILVDAIANIEVGNNLMLQGLGIFNLNINKSSISKLQTATVDNNITNK